MLSTTTRSLYLHEISDQFHSRLPHLFFNAIAIELRDMFRLVTTLLQKSAQQALQPSDLHTFYQWFEGFHGILTAIFDTENDIIFSWLEKVASFNIPVCHPLMRKRRTSKKQRIQHLCWDLLELNIQFEACQSQKSNLQYLHPLLLELKDDADHLAITLISYFRTLLLRLPPLLQGAFGSDESRMMEDAVLANFRTSEAGVFVLCACARGFLDGDKKLAFLQQSFRPPRSSKTLQKHVRRYQRKHCDLVDNVALDQLQLEVVEDLTCPKQ